MLGVESIGARDDFFALGGHSLLATQVIARIREVFGLDVPLKLLFEQRTVTDFAAAIEEEVAHRVAELSDEEAEQLLSEEA
jgi:acyl carrier protein